MKPFCKFVQLYYSAVLAHLHCKLCIFPLIGMWVKRAASQVSLEVAEDDLVSWYNHPTHQTHEPPVLDIDTPIRIYEKNFKRYTKEFCEGVLQ